MAKPVYTKSNRPQDVVTAVKPNAKKWYIFPDMLPTKRFGGINTREDETQQRGDFPIGENITFANSRIPTVRTGYESNGTEVDNITPVMRSWVYENRNGDQFELKAYGTFVDYWLVGYSTEYKHLVTGLTPGLEFGYANIGKTADTTSHTNFCNGTDSWYKFNGAFAVVSGVTTNTISIASGTWTALGFNAAPGKIMINNAEYTYTGGEGTATLTGVTGDPTGLVVAGDIAVQSPIVVTALDSFKGKVVMAHDGRMHARLETKKSIWNYSKLDDPYDWAAAASDGAGGAKEVEFGGPITAFGKLNKTALCFKNGIIKALSFNQVGTRLDSPVYTTLVTADDKGTTLGAINQKSTFSTPLGMIFVTPDKRMVLLTGVTANNEPQYLFLDDQIQPIFSKGVHDTASGICVNNIVYYSFKQDVNSSYNDVVIKGDLTRQTTTTEGKVIPCQWDAPYIGWNVADWTVVYDASQGKNVIHWHSSINSNSYRLITSKTDNTNPYNANIRTWAEHFDMPYVQKKVDYIFVEIKMTENTELLATLLYDEDGVTGTSEYVLKGTDTTHKFDSSVYNPFGSSPYGSQKIGSNELGVDLKKYRFYIETPNNYYFYNLSLQLSCDDAGNDFQLIRFGYRVTESLDKLDRTYKIGIN